MTKGAKLVNELLDVTADAKLGKALAQAYAGKTSQKEILKLLGDRVDVERVPAWVTWNVGTLAFDSIGHLGEPLFSTTTADEDEFYSYENGPQLVMSESGGLERFDGKRESSVKGTAADVARLTAYDGGGYLLASLRWVGKPPPTLAAARKLLKAAFLASGSGVPAYDKPERDAKKSVRTASVTAAPVEISATFLGGAMRRGYFPNKAPRKAPKVAWWSDNNNTGDEHGGKPVVDETLGLVFAAASAFNARVSATHIRDGKKAWTRILTKNQSWPVGSATVGGGVLYQSTNKQVFALEAKNGKVKWTANLSGVQGEPLLANGELLVGSAEGVVALSLDKGRKQWTFAVKRDDVSLGVRGGIAMADNAIYFTANEKLFAVDLATKKALWTIPAVAYTTPSVDEASVYTWTKQGLTAIVRATGKVRWVAKVKKEMSGYGDGSKTIAVAPDRLVVRLDGKLEAYDKAKGKRRWSYSYLEPDSIGKGSPIIAGDVVLCVLVDEEDSDRRVLHAADLATGKQLWQIDKLPHKRGAVGPRWHCTPTIAADGTVIVQGWTMCGLR